MLRPMPVLRLVVPHTRRPLHGALSTYHRALLLSRQPSLSRVRALTTTTSPTLSPVRTEDTPSTTTTPPLDTPTSPQPDDLTLYEGPLTQTFRRLKLFSLASLGLSFAMTPFIFTISSSLPFSARAALACTAVLTSGFSTALVAWAGRPYVIRMRRLVDADSGTDSGACAHSHNANAPAGIELDTLTFALKTLRTRVYDPVFLTDARRPFAKWELADVVQLPEAEAGQVQVGTEETVAETVDARGHVVGRWIVKWGEGGEGVCRPQGWIVRHFNVHEDLLSTPIR